MWIAVTARGKCKLSGEFRQGFLKEAAAELPKAAWPGGAYHRVHSGWLAEEWRHEWCEPRAPVGQLDVKKRKSRGVLA